VGLGKEKNVFLESELLDLTPHIADAFTKASPSQYILVQSNYNKGKRISIAIHLSSIKLQ